MYNGQMQSTTEWLVEKLRAAEEECDELYVEVERLKIENETLRKSIETLNSLKAKTSAADSLFGLNNS